MHSLAAVKFPAAVFSTLYASPKMNGERLTKWSRSTNPEICHYNISFNVERDLGEVIRRLEPKDGDIYSSYAVIRSEFTYNVYYKGHVSVSKIRKSGDIKVAVLHFLSIAGLQSTSDSATPTYNINNMTGRGKFAVDMSLPDIAVELDDLLRGTDLVLQYNPHFFGGMLMHFPKAEGGGLITLFYTGEPVKTRARTERIYIFFGFIILSCRLLLTGRGSY
jgi:TATA-box binding protein (TBP) (component of TFIID and TFIIIB)